MIYSTVYINLVSVVCCCLLLASFGVLPIEATRRHYLSVCLTVAILLLQVRGHCTGGLSRARALCGSR